MNTLTITSYILSALFLIFIFRSLNAKTLKNIWNIAKIRIKHNRQKALGNKPFFYENSKTIIYAETQPQADAKFKEFKKNRAAAKKTLKKV